MKSQVFSNYIDSINRFYVEQEPNKCIIVYNKDEVISLPDEKIFSVIVKQFQSNIFEFVKHKLKQRLSNYSQHAVVNLKGSKNLFININNGTAVLIHEHFVDKFYFKDISYFEKVYDLIAQELQSQMTINSDYVKIRMPKYENVNCINFAPAIHACKETIHNVFSSYSNDDSIINLFSPTQKIRQLFHFYDKESSAEFKSYLNVVEDIVGKSQKFYHSFQHGDFWEGNIMQNNGQLTIIDFDKTIYFSSIYDIVYFCIKKYNRGFLYTVLKDESSFDVILTNTIQLLEKDFDLNSEEVSICIKLMISITLTEYELRNDTLGKNLHLLESITK